MRYNPSTNTFFEDKKKDDKSLLPQIVWHITDFCSLKCKTCFKRNTTAELEICKDEIESTVALLKSLGVQKIDLSGGEPLTYQELPYLVEKIKSQNMHITITTRGIGSADNIQWIVKHWNLFSRIIISIDAGNSEICERYSGYNKTLENALAFCDSLNRCGCNVLRVNTVVNKLILNKEEILRIISVMRKVVPKEWCLIEPHPVNKKSTFDEYSVSTKEFLIFKKIIDTECFEDGIKIIYRSNLLYSTYWVLYPDRTIAQLSECSNFKFSCNLSENKIEQIKQQIMISDLSVPKEEKQ